MEVTMANQIKVGDKVKSYDSERRSTGVIGTVLAVNVTEVPMANGKTYSFDCPRYAIRVECNFGFDDNSGDEGTLVYPPMNGIPTWMGRFTDGVEKMEA
jgi:hypothetical protein